MIKKTYENPESELIFVKFEDDFMQGPSNPVRGAAGGEESYNEYQDEF